MCYGNLDPKTVMRETEARLKGVSFQSDAQHIPAPVPAFGLATRVRAALARLKRKDQVHV